MGKEIWESNVLLPLVSLASSNGAYNLLYESNGTKRKKDFYLSHNISASYYSPAIFTTCFMISRLRIVVVVAADAALAAVLDLL